MKLGVALSGGGIKSFSQIPVLKQLENLDLPVSYITGTSMGSAIAALYASGVKAEALAVLALDLEAQMIKSKTFVKPSPKLLPFSKNRIHGGYVDGQVLEDLFENVLKDLGVYHISDVTIPIAIPSVDLKSGKTIVFVSHPDLFKADPNWIIESDVTLAKAVRASCSFPLVIAPCDYKDYLLADGGISMNLPMEVLNAYSPSRSVGVTMNIGSGFDDIKSPLAIGNRVYDLMVASFDDLVSKEVDVMVNIPVGEVWVFELGKGREIIDKGQAVIHSYEEDLLRMKKRRFRRFRK